MMDDYRSASIMIEVPTCQACGSAGDLRYCGVKDHVFKFPGKFSYFECTECGSLWLNPRLQADDLSNAYANYYTHGAVSAGSAPGVDEPNVSCVCSLGILPTGEVRSPILMGS